MYGMPTIRPSEIPKPWAVNHDLVRPVGSVSGLRINAGANRKEFIRASMDVSRLRTL